MNTPKNDPIFKTVFGKDWDDLPPVMHKHYANRPFCDDVTIVEGILDVHCHAVLRPLLRLFKTVPTISQKQVPVRVNFTSQMDGEGFGFERVFSYKNKKPYRFTSRMFARKNGEVVEHMAAGICWHSWYEWDGISVRLHHVGYSIRILGRYIRLPITGIIGAGSAFEKPISDDAFEMSATLIHPLWGQVYEYSGWFKVSKEVGP